MAGDEESRPTRRQQLAAELRRARELRGLSGRELAQQVGISQSKVSRIESSRTIPTMPEVSAWADAVDASDEGRGMLVALAESVFTEVYSWPSTFQTRAHIQDEIEERELRARLVRNFQPSVVPGLLQTAEYARRVISISEPHSDDTVAESMAARLRRQLVLYEEDRRFEFVITESALRWRPGPPRLLLAQLDRLSSVSTLDNVSIGVIRLDVEAVTFNTHAFVIYEDHDDGQDAFVEAETVHANLIINEPGNVDLYQKRWALLAEMAVFDEEARAVFDDRMAAIRAEE